MALNPSTPGLYSDNLFNTTLFPQTTPAPRSGNKKAQYANTSVNGTSWIYDDPEDAGQFIVNLNAALGSLIYGNAAAFSCLQDNVSYPVRYVVMHNSAAPNPNPQAAAAHQLIVTAPGVYTYITTDWRIPPNYNPGGN